MDQSASFSKRVSLLITEYAGLLVNVLLDWRGQNLFYKLALHPWSFEFALSGRLTTGVMAPDIDSLPTSSHYPRRIASTSSRRARDTMAPPPASFSPAAQSPTILSREPLASGDNTGVGIGPGIGRTYLIAFAADQSADYTLSRASSSSETSYSCRPAYAT